MNRFLSLLLTVMSLAFAGCSGVDVYYSLHSEMVVVNGSSHTIAVSNADTGLDFTIVPGDEYVYASDRGIDMWWLLELIGERC